MSNSDVVIVEDDDLMGSIGKNWWILLALGAVTLGTHGKSNFVCATRPKHVSFVNGSKGGCILSYLSGPLCIQLYPGILHFAWTDRVGILLYSVSTLR